MPDYEFVLYETFDEGRIVRIMLNRPDARNAQNRGLLVELDGEGGNESGPEPGQACAEERPEAPQVVE